ncbi:MULTISPECIES: DUF485 domain-containing protein [Kitasatospora]|uniref:DUF485 domain-containing protein n=1 Tax=Kitasatospora TaxID=2063 RepID=UPI000C708B42|nr:DUF485 domain-containing protein [Kitasatospora sp. GP30]MDH6143680.1 uncharacterized membrane protein (DUF485 family) [Kitasatospora sp. GP30]
MFDPAAPSRRAAPWIGDDPRFIELRSAYRRFVFPVTAAFLLWFLTYVLCSAYARGFMATKVVGNVNVALVFGLLQFASTFGIAAAYSRFAGRRLDPPAAALRLRATAAAGEPPAVAAADGSLKGRQA